MRAHLDIAHEGSLGVGDDLVDFTFDEKSAAHLMALLTDTYSDPILAFVREYSTNARDSHIAAGNGHMPIFVTLPSSLVPNFVVQDWGVGLDRYEIEQHFSKYGWSSKRDTDDATGMLGIGCKSALSYTSQFTLIAIKNGVKETVLITRKPNGGGALQVVNTSATTEPNGVTVMIPVSNQDVAACAQRARNLFYGWDPGTVKVNGADPLCVWTDASAKHIDDNIVVVDSNSTHRHSLVMGGVIYPMQNRNSVSRQILTRVQGAIYVRAPIGAVDFTPSREELHFTKRTTAYIDEVCKIIEARYQDMARREVEQAPTAHAAMRLAYEWTSKIGNVSGFKHRGAPVPDHLRARVKKYLPHPDPKVSPKPYWENQIILSWNPRDLDNKSDSTESVWIRSLLGYDLGSDKTALHVIGYKGKYLPRPTKERVQKWINDGPLANKIGRVFFWPHAPMDWLDPSKCVSFDEIQTVPLPKAAPRKKAAKSDFEWRTINYDGDLRTHGSTRPEGRLCYTTTPDFPEAYTRRRLYQALDQIKVRCVMVRTPQIPKFEAANPDVLPFEKFCEMFAAEVKEHSTPDRLSVSALGGEVYTVLNDLGPLHDLELEGLVKRYREACKRMDVIGARRAINDLQSLIKPTSSAYKPLSDLRNEFRLASNMPIGGTSLIERLGAIKRERYPLLKFSSDKPKAMTEYLNSLYAYRQLFL